MITILKSRGRHKAGADLLMLTQAVKDALPPIRGKWFYVDPYEGSDAQDGDDLVHALASYDEGYERCVSGRGDGIANFSGGTSMAHTTSFAKKTIAWTKHGITSFGIAAPVAMFGRARVACDPSGEAEVVSSAITATIALHTITRTTGSFITDGWEVGMKGKITAPAETLVVTAVSALVLTTTDSLTPTGSGAVTVTSYIDDIIYCTGNNNRWFNMDIANWSAHALSIGGFRDAGARNYMGRCHIVGGGGAASVATKYSVQLDAAEEFTFEDGVIGADTFAHGNHADAELVLNGQVRRVRIRGSEFLSYVSAGTAHAGIKSIGTSGGTPTIAENCLFNSLLSVTTPAAAHIVSGSCDNVGTPGSKLYKFAAWGAQCYHDDPASAASAGGGIATVA